MWKKYVIKICVLEINLYICTSQLNNDKMKNEKQLFVVNEQELVTLLSQVTTPTMINLVTKTIQTDMNKTGNPFYGKVEKVTTCNYLIGTNYENRVNNNDTKEGGEGNFEAKENSVGQHITKCVLFNENTNQHYLMVEFFKESKPKTEYYFEGNSIEKHMFESWLKQRNESSRQPQERKVNVRSFKTCNIMELSLNGNKYIHIED